MSFTFSKLSILSSVVFICSVSAQAGTVLKMKAGLINTKNLEAQYAVSLGAKSEIKTWILQFKSSVKSADKEALVKGGHEVLGYLPDDAVVIKATASEISEIKSAMPQLQAVVPYLASFKISSQFGPTSVFNKDEMVSVVVKSFKASDIDALASRIAKLDARARVLQTSGKIISVILPRSTVSMVAGQASVEHVQPSVEMVPMSFKMDLDPGTDYGMSVLGAASAGDYKDLTSDETGTKAMNFDAIWALGYHGEGQIAGMADTGLDTGGSDLDMDFASAVNEGQIYGLFSKSWGDPMGHGTHVAGSIVGRGVRSDGAIKGGAYAAKFVAQGMWSPMMKNLTVPPKLGDMFTKAYAAGVRVHSNSWGAAKNFGAYDSFANQVDEFMYNNPDMLILFAAGNSGVDADKDGRIDPGSISSPGTAKNCLTVGASENSTKTGGIQVPLSKLRSAKDNWPAEPIFSSYVSDNINGVAMFSSRGPTSDGRT